MKLAEIIITAFFCVVAAAVFVLAITISVMDLVNEARAKREREKKQAEEATQAPEA